MKRRRDLEFPWVGFKNAFWIPGYVFTSKSGKRYVVWGERASVKSNYKYRLGTGTRISDHEYDDPVRDLIRPYFLQEYEQGYGKRDDAGTRIHHRPFWYNHRIYELEDGE
jgi:hypothetical protein